MISNGFSLVVLTVFIFSVNAFQNYNNYGQPPSHPTPVIGYLYQGGPPPYGFNPVPSSPKPGQNYRQPTKYATPILRSNVKVQSIYNNSAIRGFNATPTEFLYQASLQTQDGRHICGGVIIAPAIVLTSAQCAGNIPHNLYVVAGTHNLQNGGNKIQVNSIKTHPQFNNTTKEFDIAILYLRNTFNKANIRPVQLPKKNEKIFANAMVTISGWGSEGRGQLSSTLKYINVPLMEHKVCKSLLNQVKDSMICEGELHYSRQSCPGDFGGPLTKENTLVGLLSWTHGCNSGKPTVFTYVAGVRDWIKNLAGV